MIIWIILALISSIRGCDVVMQGIGTVSPFGDIKELVGSTIRLQCRLFQTAGGDSLVWSVNSTLVPSKYISVIDNYTSELVIPNATVERSGSYICRFKNKTAAIPQYVCHNIVSIGYMPLQPNDFFCVSPNWEYLECSFTKPFNPIEATYEIKYGRRTNFTSICDTKVDKKRNMVICNITKESKTPYSQVSTLFNMSVTGSNSFGNKTWYYAVEQFKLIKPNAPENVTFTQSNSHSWLLSWHPAVMTKLFPPGFIYKVYYRSQWDSDGWTIVELKSNLTLHDLQPFTNYTFKIQTKSAIAIDERLWSKNATKSFITDPDVPSKPPNISSHLFQERSFLNNRTVILFWQMIPLYQRNGKLFKYTVTASTGDNHIVYRYDVMNNFVTFDNLLLEEEYKFKITSANEIGASLDYSEIIVPRKSELLFPPERFTVIYFGTGVYELSWQSANYQHVETNYTLYWCDAIKSHPFMCEGNLSWVQVDSNTRAYNLTFQEHKNYQFAIAAHTPQKTSGVVWATCTVPYNGIINKMKTVKLAAIDAYSIKVTWKLDCSERIGIVTGYKIYSCNVANNSDKIKCLGEQRAEIKNGAHSEEYTIKYLKPFNYYKITVSALTRAGEGEQSDGKFIKTMQDLPVLTSQSLIINSITNTTLNVSWDEPDAPNGYIDRYEIVYYDTRNNFKRKLVDSPTERSLIINGLTPFTNYTLSFKACNVMGCSNSSKEIVEETAIGVPSVMAIPTISGVNATHVMTTFEDPTYPNGPIDYYNLMVFIQKDEETNYTEEWFHNITLHEFLVSTKCSEPDFQSAIYSFAVEAVNLFHGSPLVGPLSELATYSCYPISGPLATTKIVGIVAATVGVILIISFFIFGYVRFRQRYREIQNIKIYLPKGLESKDYKSPSCDFNSIQTYPNLKHNAWIKAPNNKLSNGNARHRSSSGETRLSITSMDELLQSQSDGRLDHPPACETGSALSSLSSVQTTRSNVSSESSDSLPPTTPDADYPENPMANIHKILMPSTTLEVLPEASPPANYSHFGRSYDGSDTGYLPINGRNSQDGGYVLPSDPQSPSTAYSQLGLAEQNPPYTNYPNEPPAPAAYCQIAAISPPQPEPFRRCNNGYVSAEAAPILSFTTPQKKTEDDTTKLDPIKCPSTSETEDLPIEYSRLSFHDPKTNTGYVALPDVSHLINNANLNASKNNSKPEKPTEGQYVALDVVEEVPSNFLEIKSSDEGMRSSMASDDMMKSSINSDAAMKSSMTSDDAMKSSMTSEDAMKSSSYMSEDAMKSSITSENAMKSSMTSDDAMKSSMTSDGFDNSPAYSRVVSMNLDESDVKES